MGGKVTIDKRTIEASYVYSLVNEYNNEYPTTFQVLRRYLKKQDYSDEDIQKIVEDECFDNVVSAVRYGDYLSNVKSIMEQFAGSRLNKYSFPLNSNSAKSSAFNAILLFSFIIVLYRVF